ncbi:HPr kinase/phosphorylase [Pseudaestuariivita sp.]|uniref:HPr kinase/phosphorylase n=1 Tax=Pseudaestuariivita sp. TaxID=2211669 RepID=UPI004059C171
MDLAARVTGSTIHGSAAAVGGDRGVLILGPSGSGKSALTLQLMAFGAELVADDQVALTADAGGVQMAAPETIRGSIEARGIGILRAAPIEQARLRLVVDLEDVSNARLPPPRHAHYLGHAVPLISAVQHAYFAAAVLQFLKQPDPV